MSKRVPAVLGSLFLIATLVGFSWPRPGPIIPFGWLDCCDGSVCVENGCWFMDDCETSADCEL